jgi:hypothetical protein
LQLNCLGWPWASILLISVSQIARIICMSHWLAPSLGCLIFDPPSLILFGQGKKKS